MRHIQTTESLYTRLEASQVISGTAVGVGDVTRGTGSGGRKVWTAEELEAAASSLVGVPVKALHSETEIGEVTDAEFIEDKGIVYEAEIEDSEIADSIADGRLTVSIEARHADGGLEDTRHGEAMRATDIEFDGMAVVQKGASPSASAEPGSAAALSVSLDAMLESDDPASTEGDASDIDISDSTEEGLQNKVDEHNDAVEDSGKEVTLGDLKKVYRRGAGAWFSSNRGATQSQWAYARVNEFLSDLKDDKPLNDGHDNDLAPDGYDAPDGDAQSAALVDINGTEVDIEPPDRVINAVDAAFEAKDEYSDEIGDCGTGVGEEMGEAIRSGELTPEILTNGGDISQNSPATYLDSHSEDAPSTDDPPTDWGRMEWLGMESEDDSPRCGPVQLALWGFYLEWFDETKSELEDAMSDEQAEAAATDLPEYEYSNPGEAVTAAKFLDFDEDNLAGDEMIHTVGDGEDTVFMPGPTHEALEERLEERGELMEDIPSVVLPMPDDAQLLYPTAGQAAAVARKMDLGTLDDDDSALVHAHDYEGGEYYMPGREHEEFVDRVTEMQMMMNEREDSETAAMAETKNVGPITFEDTMDGDLDESEIPNDDYEGHYLNAADTKSASSFPLVDGDGNLRRGNLDAGWNLRGQGDLGMPRKVAERVMLNLGLVFGPEDSEENPLPEEAYEQARDDPDMSIGTPYAAESASAVSQTQTQTDDPHGEDLGGSGQLSEDSHEMTQDKSQIHEEAILGSNLAEVMAGDMQEEMSKQDRDRSEMMDAVAMEADMSKDAVRSMMMGDTMCPSMELIEGFAESVEGADMDMLISAAERDGCEYSSMGYGDNEDENMTQQADMSDEVEQAKREFASALAAGSDLFDADDLVERFSLTELSERYESHESATLAEEPVVQSGADNSETANLSGQDAERVSEIDARIETLQEHDTRLAAVEIESLEEERAKLTGE